VVHVVDGDTIDVQLDGRKVRVRYIGMNTPETKHPTKGQELCGPEASAANRQLVAGQTVRLELDVQPWDRYQRLLAYVYVSDVMVNAELVRQGYA
jgi:micrococcal nuclease